MYTNQATPIAGADVIRVKLRARAEARTHQADLQNVGKQERERLGHRRRPRRNMAYGK